MEQLKNEIAAKIVLGINFKKLRGCKKKFFSGCKNFFFGDVNVSFASGM